MAQDLVYASLIISGDTLDPGYWTRFLSRAPDRSATKGSDFIDASGKRITGPSRRGLWIASTRGWLSSDTPDDHLAALAPLFAQGTRISTALAARGEKMCVSIFVANYDGAIDPKVSDRYRQAVERAGGTLELDIYPQVHEFQVSEHEIKKVIV